MLSVDTHCSPHTSLAYQRREMGPKAPDWKYLQSLQPDGLEEDDIDKVFTQYFITL